MAKAYRLPIAINPETKVSMQRLADVTSSSVSQIASSFLNGLAPQFEQLADAYTLALTDPAAAAQLLGALADSNIEELREEQLELLDAVQPKPAKKRATK
jgi:hypothetical protein